MIMEREIVSKYLKLFGAFGMLVVSAIDIISFILLTLIPFSAYAGGEVFYIVLMFNINDLLASILWVSFIGSLVTYVISGLFLLRFSNNSEVNEYTYSKHMFLFGVALLIISFIHSEFLYLIYINTSISELVVPFFILIFFISINCYVLILSIVIGGVGLYWVLKNEGEIKD
jgi:hypothetical protein